MSTARCEVDVSLTLHYCIQHSNTSRLITPQIGNKFQPHTHTKQVRSSSVVWPEESAPGISNILHAPTSCMQQQTQNTSCLIMQESHPGSPSSAASSHQQPVAAPAGEAVPLHVWQLCGVPPNLQATSLVDASHALLLLGSVQCPLEVVTCLQHADQAIAAAVGHVR